ncbi:MAG: response regulator [bacterium]|nr:response regulator [bacterium]
MTAARILVVDDDATTRFLARSMLEASGFAVTEAADGREALARFQEDACDLVLMDGLMPVMDGFAACAAIRSLPGGRQVPVIMLSGLEDEPSLERAVAAGASDFMRKPLDYASLARRLRMMLQHQRATGAAPAAPPALERLVCLVSHALRHSGRLAVLAIHPGGRPWTTGGDLLEGDSWREAAVRLRDQLRREDNLDQGPAMGGEDGDQVAEVVVDKAFLVFLQDLRTPADAARVAGRLCAALEAPGKDGTRPAATNPRVGIALFPEDGAGAEILVERALQALRATSGAAGNPFHFHDREREEAARREAELVEAVGAVLEARCMELRCQPLRTPRGVLLGARLQPWSSHELLRSLAPSALISLAREGGRLASLYLSLIDQAADLATATRVSGRTARLVLPVLAELLPGSALPAALRRLVSSAHDGSSWLELECGDDLPRSGDEIRRLLEPYAMPGVVLALPPAGLASLLDGGPAPATLRRVHLTLGGDQPGRAAGEHVRQLARLAQGLGLELRVGGAFAPAWMQGLADAGWAEAVDASAEAALPPDHFVSACWLMELHKETT